MKRDCDLCVREQKCNVGDFVCYRRNAGIKVESVWRGPGVFMEVKLDSVYVVKSLTDQKQ